MGIIWLYVNCIFNFFRTHHIVFHNGYLIKFPPTRYMESFFIFLSYFIILTMLLLLLLSRFSRVWLCLTQWTAAHQAPLSLGFSRQEHWSGLPFPSPMHENVKWKWSRSVVSNSSRLHGLQPTRLLHPWDFPGKSTGVGCYCLLRILTIASLKVSHSVVSDSLQPHGICSPWNSPGQNTVMGSHSLLQGIFPTQE